MCINCSWRNTTPLVSLCKVLFYINSNGIHCLCSFDVGMLDEPPLQLAPAITHPDLRISHIDASYSFQINLLLRTYDGMTINSNSIHCLVLHWCWNVGWTTPAVSTCNYPPRPYYSWVNWMKPTWENRSFTIGVLSMPIPQSSCWHTQDMEWVGKSCYVWGAPEKPLITLICGVSSLYVAKGVNSWVYNTLVHCFQLQQDVLAFFSYTKKQIMQYKCDQQNRRMANAHVTWHGGIEPDNKLKLQIFNVSGIKFIDVSHSRGRTTACHCPLGSPAWVQG